MEKFKEWLLNNLLTIITIINPIIVSIITYIYKKIEKEINTFEIFLFIIIIIQCTLIFIYCIWRKKSYESYYYPWSKIRSEYEIIEKKVNYNVEKQTHRNGKNKSVEYYLNFSVCKKIKSLRRKLERIPGKFLWTGKNDAKLPISSTGDEIRWQDNKKGTWKFYDIILNKTLFKGEKADVNTYHDPIGNCKSSSPFVSSSTEEPTKKLVFNIDLGKEYAKSKIIVDVFRSNESTSPLKSTEFEFDECGKFTLEIKNPNRFRYYVVHWEWN